MEINPHVNFRVIKLSSEVIEMKLNPQSTIKDVKEILAKKHQLDKPNLHFVGSLVSDKKTLDEFNYDKSGTIIDDIYVSETFNEREINGTKTITIDYVNGNRVVRSTVDVPISLETIGDLKSFLVTKNIIMSSDCFAYSGNYLLENDTHLVTYFETRITIVQK